MRSDPVLTIKERANILRIISREFDGRHGHGGAKVIGYRRMTRRQLIDLLREAVLTSRTIFTVNEDAETGGNCPHGAPRIDCVKCDREADLAFDTAREDRIFGRNR